MSATSSPSLSPSPPPPARRRLRGYAFDPSLSLKLDTFTINEIIYEVPWEKLKYEGESLAGEYLEIVDRDPTIGKSYSVVNLDDPHLLATDGLAPSESNPHFHQQMVYAVAMTTIHNFEIGLGRKVFWSSRRIARTSSEKNAGTQEPTGENTYKQKKKAELQASYVPRLRIYPHALREANAYYSPQKKALLFGYFEATPADSTQAMPGSLVFTCLSHDIIAHETAHAILEGMFPYYNEPTNPDVLAFHEAFADIVALFQHFTFPAVLRHQISLTRGNLEGQNLLGQLAQQFGTAIGGYGSLRDAIGGFDETTKKWVPAQPDPTEYQLELKPHKRGSILVAAVFEAFLAIYRRRVADLLRIASGGSGILGEGELHPDLVNRLAYEAAECSKQILHMCIRALDYCPPVDLTFGEYLRGIITADMDLNGETGHIRRLAFIDAFRRRGIYPKGIRTLSMDALCHPRMMLSEKTNDLLRIIGEFLRQYRSEVQYPSNRQAIFIKSNLFIGGATGLHTQISIQGGESVEFQKLSGMVWRNSKTYGVMESRLNTGVPRFSIQTLCLAARNGPEGKPMNNIVFSLIQRAGISTRPGDGVHFLPETLPDDEPVGEDMMILRGGCTFIYDLDTLKLKYAVSKPLLLPDTSGEMKLDEERIRSQHAYQTESGPASMSGFHHYFSTGFALSMDEPFALLHQH